MPPYWCFKPNGISRLAAATTRILVPKEVAAMTTRAPVRKDRKFFLSLELHREIDRIMGEDPERVRERGLRGVEKVRPNVRGGAVELVDEWRRLLTSRDWDGIRRHLTSEDEHSAEMRNVTVFLGVVSQQRRQEIVDEVLARGIPA
jgi:hypothetical protein